MKTVWRIVLILAGILVLLGVATMAVSLFSGGGIGDLRNRVMLTNYNQSFEAEEVQTLHVEALVGEVTLMRGEELRVEAKNVIENGFFCTLEDGCLTVREQDSPSWADKLSRLLLLRRNTPEICIYLPAELNLAQADLQLQAGRAQIEGLDAQKLKIEMQAGVLTATQLSAQEAEITLSAGTMELSSLQAQTLQLRADAGNVKLQAAVESYCSVDVAAGTAALTLSGSAADYTARISAGAGKVTCDGHSYSAGYTTLGQGAKTLYLQNGAGSIRVDFAG
ncbi:MAG: DUF4097 domain-containing protein [Ruminococcaceae bacterium]|nr:DUF4097 domain-containing protein [Oscillospiraceae bacterium]